MKIFSFYTHVGYFKLRETLEQLGKEYFVFTSIFDGFFRRSDYLCSSIYEVHGSINRLQCRRGLDCGRHTWSAEDLHIEVDLEQMLATSPLPRCIKCEDFARPNVLLFGDRHWVPHAVIKEENLYEAWLAKLRAEGKQIVTIELGAGQAVMMAGHIELDGALTLGQRLDDAPAQIEAALDQPT